MRKEENKSKREAVHCILKASPAQSSHLVSIIASTRFSLPGFSMSFGVSSAICHHRMGTTSCSQNDWLPGKSSGLPNFSGHRQSLNFEQLLTLTTVVIGAG